MVSVWPFAVPVRGKLETTRIVPVRLAPVAAAAAGLGEATAAADGDATADGLAAGLAAAAADGLAAAAAAGDAAAAVVGLAGAAVAGAVVGWAPPPHAATNKV